MQALDSLQSQLRLFHPAFEFFEFLFGGGLHPFYSLHVSVGLCLSSFYFPIALQEMFGELVTPIGSGRGIVGFLVGIVYFLDDTSALLQPS